MKTDDQASENVAEAPSAHGAELGGLPVRGFSYLSMEEIPSEIHDAVNKIHIYFEKQGMREWEFSHLADRRLVVKLERERDAYRAELQNIANARPSEWGEMADQFQSWAQNRARSTLNSANKQISGSAKNA